VRWLEVLAVSLVLVATSFSVASAETAAMNHPPVDLGKFVVTELPAGTPQTSAAATLDPSYVEQELLVRARRRRTAAAWARDRWR
jgi:hypothetical protein